MERAKEMAGGKEEESETGRNKQPRRVTERVKNMKRDRVREGTKREGMARRVMELRPEAIEKRTKDRTGDENKKGRKEKNKEC